MSTSRIRLQLRYADAGDPVIAYGLSKRVKYCRLVRRRIRGKTYCCVQLVCEGKPLSLKDRKSLNSRDEKMSGPKRKIKI